MHPTSEPAPASGGVLDRPDLPRSALDTAWPLAAVALLVLMLLRACFSGVAGDAQPFEPAAATRQANEAALGGLRALPAQPDVDLALSALNAVVINFASGADVVPAEVGELLDEAARVIALLPPSTRILITGHTDNVGDPAANLALSERRAAAVRAALLARGAPPDALDVRGVGGSMPVADNGTDVGRFYNRRIEFSPAP